MASSTSLSGSNAPVTKPHSGGYHITQRFVGESVAMRNLRGLITKVAHDSLAPVLIQGESGTGKELVALAVHHESCRAEHPFVAINCGSIVPTLFESELFGHEKELFLVLFPNERDY